MEDCKVPVVEFRNITKNFPGVKALDHVSFKVMPGEVHCLLGENGAGKSTLMKILTGVYQADEGEILIHGESVQISDTLASRRLRIGIVFQENSLVQDLSVAENIFLTREFRNKAGLIDWHRMYSECEKWCNDLGVSLNVRSLVRRLSVAEQQIVEIIKVFSQNPEIVILDEPTSALADKEIDNLFRIIKLMRQKGITFIYISHRLEEIKEIGTSASVLRDGQFIVSIDDVSNIHTDDIISYIVGRKLDQQYPSREHNIGEEVLRVEGITIPKKIYDISFTVKKGEVLGLCGLMASGRTTTAKAIYGAIRYKEGKLFLHGKEITIHSPHQAIQNKIGLLPEDRKGEGLILGHSVAWNVTISALSKYCRGPFINHKKESADIKHYISEVHVKTPSVDRKVKFLSGGNQQKVVFAKCLFSDAEVFIFDEPTRGIDVGAKSEIYGIINNLVENGKSVIVISSELPELLGITDRILVYYEGRIVADMNNDNLTQEQVMYYALGGFKVE